MPTADLHPAGVAKRTNDEPVAVFVPTWNIETWFAYLGGEKVDESKRNYPRLSRERDYYLEGRSRYVAFHCVQAILLALAVIAGGAVAVILLLPGVMLATAVGSQLGEVPAMLLVALAWVLGLGLAALPPILAFVAGVRALRGRWWRVPVLGRWALRWLDRPSRLDPVAPGPTNPSAGP